VNFSKTCLTLTDKLLLPVESHLLDPFPDVLHHNETTDIKTPGRLDLTINVTLIMATTATTTISRTLEADIPILSVVDLPTAGIMGRRRRALLKMGTISMDRNREAMTTRSHVRRLSARPPAGVSLLF
jgi:hypothetical protein